VAFVDKAPHPMETGRYGLTRWGPGRYRCVYCQRPEDTVILLLVLPEGYAVPAPERTCFRCRWMRKWHDGRTVLIWQNPQPGVEWRMVPQGDGQVAYRTSQALRAAVTVPPGARSRRA